MPVYVFRAGRPQGSGLPVSWNIRSHQWRVIQRASDRPARFVEPAPLDALKRNTRLMIEGCLMTESARLTCTSNGPKRVPFVFAAMIAAAILPNGFASAEPDSYGAVNSRAVPKSAAADLVSQIGDRKFRWTILALDSSSSAPSSRAACDMAMKRSCEELVQDNILWKIDKPDDSASKHWQQKNLDNLCACTTDPYATVNCFQIQVNNNGKTWQEAIAMCHAKP
jgi:hypothetical protein